MAYPRFLQESIVQNYLAFFPELPYRSQRINWRGKPLRSYETIIELIGNARTKNSLKISADIDMGSYDTGEVVAEEDLKNANLIRDDFHCDWNYAIGTRDNTNRDVIS